MTAVDHRYEVNTKYLSKLEEAGFEFVGRDGRLYANGQSFSIKGINWFGSEAYNGPPNGLEEHSIGWYMDFLQRNEFKCARRSPCVSKSHSRPRASSLWISLAVAACVLQCHSPALQP